ncbi:MAG: hypothetical protein ACK4YF_05125 [Exilispira sp.]
MSDHFKYYLKPEERKSYQIKKKTSRKWNVIFTLANVGLLIVIFFFIYKPAIDRLNKENKVYVDNFSIEIEYELTENNIIVDLYILNESNPEYFDFSKLSCSLFFLDNEEIQPIRTRNDKELISHNNGLHYLLSFNIKGKKNMNFFIKLKFDNRTIYESKTIKFRQQ